jgi:polyprenyl-phospho-N-acetylgalactosaminyl synthase
MQKKQNLKIICVIPAFNEIKGIAKVVRSVLPYFDQVVVVDDGSSDNTAQAARQNGALVLVHLKNRGQGAALETGNEYARRTGADIVVHYDGDGQFCPEDIPLMLAPVVSGEADMVFGSRFMGKESNMPPFKKKVIYPLARLVNSWFFQIKLGDPQNGFRVFGRKSLEKVRIELDGFAHCTEIMHKAFRFKLRVREIPVKVHYAEFGLGFKDGLNIFKDLLIAKLFY